MTEPWSRFDQAGLARYVTKDSARFLRLPVDPLALEAQPDGRRELTAAIYRALAGAGLRYAREEYHPSQAQQVIRTPAELLTGQGRGTCLDLAALFCGACLGYDLLPLLVVLDGHAIAAVSTTHGLPDWDALDRRERELFAKGPLTDQDVLRELIVQGRLIPVECTGFAAAAHLPAILPEGAGRVAGQLSFEDAVAAGARQLDTADRPLAFALDIATAWCGWRIEPFRLTGHSCVHLGNGRLLEIGEHRNRLLAATHGPTVRPLPRPVRPSLRPLRDFLGREDQLRASWQELPPHSVIVVCGEGGAGRTALLRQLAHRDRGDELPDGTVFLPARGQAAEDVFQSLFEAFHLPDEPYRPDRDDLAGALAELRALVLIDDADELPPAEIRWLAKAMPHSRIVLTARRKLMTDAVAVDLPNLPAELATALLADRLNHPAPAATEQLAAQLHGHPADLMLAAHLVNAGTFTAPDLASWLDGAPAARPLLVAALVNSLSAAEKAVISLLAGLGEPISTQHVGDLVGALDAEEGLRALRRRGLITSDPPHVALTPSFAAAVRAAVATGPWLERALDHLVDWAAQHADDPDRLVADAPALLAATRWAAEHRRWAAVAALARATVPALTLAGRWGARGALLGLAFQAAAQLADLALRDWAEHQLDPPGDGPPPAESGSEQQDPGPDQGNSGSHSGSSGSSGGVSTAVKIAVLVTVLAAGAVGIAVAVNQNSRSANPTPTTRPTQSADPPETITLPPTFQSATRTTPPRTTTRTQGPTMTSAVDTFPVGVRKLGVTVLANGFRFHVSSVEARRTAGGRPEVIADVSIFNELWDVPTELLLSGPPELRAGGKVNTVQLSKLPSVPPKKEVATQLVFSEQEGFQWEGATLAFPVYGRGNAAIVPLSGSGKAVVLAPGTVKIAGSLKSGKIRLDFRYGGMFRTDVALDTRNYDPKGLGVKKGSLRIFFDVVAEEGPAPGGISVGFQNFQLTGPNGRAIPVDNGPILLVQTTTPQLREAIATQIDTPATGTYKLTFTIQDPEKPAAPASITFTITDGG